MCVRVRVCVFFFQYEELGSSAAYSESPEFMAHMINPIALRTAKTPSSFGHSESNRVK